MKKEEILAAEHKKFRNQYKATTSGDWQTYQLGLSAGWDALQNHIAKRIEDIPQYNSSIPTQSLSSSKLKPKTQRLLDQLVEDAGNPGLPPENRIFDKKWSYIYIYNLLTGNYEFSGNEYKELFLYLTSR